MLLPVPPEKRLIDPSKGVQAVSSLCTAVVSRLDFPRSVRGVLTFFGAIRSQQHRAVPPERAQQPNSNKQGGDHPNASRAAPTRVKRYTAPPATHIAVHCPSDHRAMHCLESTAAALKLLIIMPRGVHGRTARAAVAAISKRVGWKAGPNQPVLPAAIVDPPKTKGLLYF
ncbi:hypothetical protein NDU88_002253 [Pleurodeles waltl]|uniref:Uncharacterized protein n=1 Tax=Pleurodeles waltl TaxID=8319 RepID=A0AAV7LC01_PLEWA|nr:hypothetical protein NDU88_002253 [Pleurodeles waltl]